MKYAKLGNSELKVSRICMGCMGFGDAGKGQHSWTMDEEHTQRDHQTGIWSWASTFLTPPSPIKAAPASSIWGGP